MRKTLICLAIGLASLLPVRAEYSRNLVKQPVAKSNADNTFELVELRKDSYRAKGRILEENPKNIRVELLFNGLPLLITTYEKERVEEIRRWEIKKERYFFSVANNYDNRYDLDRYEKAIEFYNKALDVNPDFNEAREKLEACKEELPALLEMEKKKEEIAKIKAERRLTEKKLKEIETLRARVKSLEERLAEREVRLRIGRRYRLRYYYPLYLRRRIRDRRNCKEERKENLGKGIRGKKR